MSDLNQSVEKQDHCTTGVLDEDVTDDREKDRVSDATPDVDTTDTSSEDEQETFPRKYVEELRTENGTYRNRAKDAEAKADELAQALWTERVRSLGVLADPADLPYDPEALDDLEQIKAQADDLLASKPHLRTRQITERVGQGERGAEAISLVELLQRGA